MHGEARFYFSRRCGAGRGSARQGKGFTKMITATVTVQGTMSILLHRFGEAAEAAVDAETRKIKVQKHMLPRDAAEAVCYRTKTGEIYLPGAAFSRLLREAGGGHKLRGSRKSAKYVVPAATLVLQDAVILRDLRGAPLRDFEVDSRPVVIPSTKGRIMRHRPRLDEWRAGFDLRIDTSILDSAFVQQLLVEGGQQIGVGDFRPERGGPFGTFRVISWDEAPAAVAAQ